MGHAAQEKLLDKTFPLSAHDDQGNILGFQKPENNGEGMPRGKAVVNYGNPGFQ